MKYKQRERHGPESVINYISIRGNKISFHKATGEEVNIINHKTIEQKISRLKAVKI